LTFEGKISNINAVNMMLKMRL